MEWHTTVFLQPKTTVSSPYIRYGLGGNLRRAIVLAVVHLADSLSVPYANAVCPLESEQRSCSDPVKFVGVEY